MAPRPLMNRLGPVVALLCGLALADDAQLRVKRAIDLQRAAGGNRSEAALAEVRAALRATGEIRLSAAEVRALLPLAAEPEAVSLIDRAGSGRALASALQGATAEERASLMLLAPKVADPLPLLPALIAAGDEAARDALFAIRWEGRALDAQSRKLLADAAAAGGTLSVAAASALRAAAAESETRLPPDEGEMMGVEDPLPPPPPLFHSVEGLGADRPRKVKVFYGTDRALFSPSWSDYAQRFWPAVALLLLTPLLVRALLWLLHPRFTRIVRGARWAGYGGGAVLAVYALYGMLLQQRRIERLGLDYGAERGAFYSSDNYCHFGTCTVGIPPRHEAGRLERPGLLSAHPWEDPQEHVMILKIAPLAKGEFLGELAEAGGERAFVFVHGFNVTFERAALRTAQIAHDLEFSGAPIFFSWPSRGDVLQYTVDESTVAWATHHLKLFLRDVRRALPAATIHLVAHSMGNRALTEALRSLREEIAADLPRFQEVILAAPDIDAATFRDDVVPALRPTAERVTLYCAPFDSALEVSRRVHGYPRAGDSSNGVFVAEGLETVDVAVEDRDVLGHSYYGTAGPVLRDIISLMLYRKRPEERGLVAMGGFWRLSE